MVCKIIHNTRTLYYLFLLFYYYCYDYHRRCLGGGVTGIIIIVSSPFRRPGHPGSEAWTMVLWGSAVFWFFEILHLTTIAAATVAYSRRHWRLQPPPLSPPINADVQLLLLSIENLDSESKHGAVIYYTVLRFSNFHRFCLLWFLFLDKIKILPFKNYSDFGWNSRHFSQKREKF